MLLALMVLNLALIVYAKAPAILFLVLFSSYFKLNQILIGVPSGHKNSADRKSALKFQFIFIL